LLQGDQTLVFEASGVNRPDPRYLHWLNGGNGQMGDLVTHRARQTADPVRIGHCDKPALPRQILSRVRLRAS